VVGELSETGDYGQADQVFATGDADLDAASVLSFDDEGGDSGVYEIDGVHRLVLALEECAETERCELKVRFEDVEFFLRDSEEDGVTDRSSSRGPQRVCLISLECIHVWLDEGEGEVPSRGTRVFACRCGAYCG